MYGLYDFFAWGYGVGFTSSSSSVSLSLSLLTPTLSLLSKVRKTERGKELIDWVTRRRGKGGTEGGKITTRPSTK